MMPERLRIGGREVGPGCPTYVIAEIGANHNQDLNRALDMIGRAAAAGADAVKFQSLRFDRLYHPAHVPAGFRDWFRQIELDERWYPALANRAAEEGVHFLSSPTYREAADLLVEVGAPAFKIASPQMQGNIELLEYVAGLGRPMLMSVGYCLYEDIQRALNSCLAAGNAQIALLHCIAKYPMDPAEANLQFIRTLSALSGVPVGYSDHSLGRHLAVAAVTLGACVIEKHVTLDRTLPGPDHHFALVFDEFAEMVREIRDVERAVGTGVRLVLLPEEMELRAKVALKAFTRGDVRQGDRLTAADVHFLRCAEDGLPPEVASKIIGAVACRDLSAGTLLKPGDVESA